MFTSDIVPLIPRFEEIESRHSLYVYSYVIYINSWDRSTDTSTNRS